MVFYEEKFRSSCSVFYTMYFPMHILLFPIKVHDHRLNLPRHKTKALANETIQSNIG